MKKKKDKAVEAVLEKAKLETLTTALGDILRLRCPKEGKENYEQTLSMIRSRARMTLDVVAAIGAAQVDKKEKNTAKADK